MNTSVIRTLAKRNIKACQFSTETISAIERVSGRRISNKHLNDINKYFETNPSLEQYRKYIPPKILYYRQKSEDQIYLICPNTAKTAAKHILQRIKGNNDQVIAEINPGLGILTKELLDGGLSGLKLYEPNHLFHPIMKEILQDRFQKVEIIESNLLDLGKYAYLDSKDQGGRVEKLLKDVPNKKWTDDPSMVIIGTMLDLPFLKHLAITMILQQSIWNKGRLDLYVFTTPAVWSILAETTDIPIYYRYWMILFNIFFKTELLDIIDRKLFMPWITPYRKKSRSFPYSLDRRQMYLIKLTMNEKFAIDNEDMVHFLVFLKSFTRVTDRIIIPTIEKWIPGSGKNILVPKQDYQDYLNNINIFTKFKELTPMQTLAVFKELISHPNYRNSPIMELIENELMTYESVLPNSINMDKITKKVLDNLNI